MNKLIKILESIGIATIMLLIMCAIIGLLLVVLSPFVCIFALGATMLVDVVGDLGILIIVIGIVVTWFAIQIYKNVL